MTAARIGAAVAAALAILLPLSAQTPAGGQPQTFRTGAEAVIVDVSVRDGDRAVTGLGAADFLVTDNGVTQRIEHVEATAVPIDVTLVVDVSGTARPLDRSAPARAVRTAVEEVAEVSRLLRPGDRIRVLAVDGAVRQVVPMQPVGSPAALQDLAGGGMGAVYDTLAAALLQPVEPSRRHVVIARTKGVDTISSVNAAAVSAIAQQSDALLHVVIMETALANEDVLSGFQCNLMGLCWPSRRFWEPFRRRLVALPRLSLLPEGQAIAEGARATGGAVHQAVGLSEPTLVGTFRRAFDDFRNSYVLRYTPQGVPQRGWHTIAVTLKGPRSFAVRARKGYHVEEPPAAPRETPLPDVPRTIAELTDAYDRQAYRQVVQGLRAAKDPLRLIRDFEEAGNPWPAIPRREAAFVLELAESAIFSTQAETRREGYALLQRYSDLVRHPLEPDAFERIWRFAVLTILEGAIRPDVLEPFAVRALERFPGEPRFLLSRAIAIDQRWATRGERAASASRLPSSDHAKAVREAYAAAFASEETAAEARIRLALFQHRAGEHTDALAHLQAAAPAQSDQTMRYLRELFRGHVLWALGRQDEAVAAYRAANAVAPRAQSARVALMNALLMRGERSEAEALGNRIQTEDPGLDPWWTYWQGHYRVHPQVMARARELGR